MADFSLTCKLLEDALGKEHDFLQLINVRNFITDYFIIIFYFNKKQNPFPGLSFEFEFALQSCMQKYIAVDFKLLFRNFFSAPSYI